MTKTCEVCGGAFTKPGQISYAQWEARRFCSKSCAASERNRTRPAPIRHGHARVGRKSPTYLIWKGMRQRCLDPRAKKYPLYGGRGVSICERWSGEHGFENFLADMGERPPGLSIDRIDPDGDYEPQNCRWATASEQRRNQRRTRAAA
jgi:hypothetical protein